MLELRYLVQVREDTEFKHSISFRNTKICYWLKLIYSQGNVFFKGILVTCEGW